MDYDMYLSKCQDEYEKQTELEEIVLTNYEDALDFVIEHDILTDEEIEIAVGFGGASLKTLDYAVFYKTGALSILDYYFR